MTKLVQAPRLNKKKAFYGNQWTRLKQPLQYSQRDQKSIELCLAILFCGFVAKADNGYKIFFTRYQSYFISWFKKTFGLSITKSKGGSNERVNAHGYGQARDFIEAAQQDGWRFKTHDWHIPQPILQRYPILILQYWLGVQVRYFLFATRKNNMNRHALTLQHLSVNQAGLEQISDLLARYGIEHTLYEKRGQYDVQFLKSPKPQEKVFYNLSIYQVANVEKLFDTAGWYHPTYVNHQTKSVQRYVQNYILPDVHR